ncbi:caldesmon-like [Ischnura elegans]|uniref:caldesmon-like n=1 Tax=Ischnura elegans TaxID=197161 RepID=UPI001ED897E5|nr:caldesmon-like [Ischnura elegans]
MNMDLQMFEAFSAMPSQLMQNCMMADNKDLERLRELCARYALVKEDSSCKGIAVDKKRKDSTAEDKENFLMPAPKMPVRSGIRKRKTNDVISTPGSRRVTRSSRMTGVMSGDVSMTDKPKRGRATRATQVLSPGRGVNDSYIACNSDSSMTEESKKSRRGTKTVNEAAPRASRRATHARASSRIGTQASNLASTCSSSRKSCHGVSEFQVCDLQAEESVQPTRATRAAAGKASYVISSRKSSHGVSDFKVCDAQAEASVQPARATRATAGKVSHVIASDEHMLKSPSQLSKKTTRQKSLFSPYDKNTVKNMVEAFEGLSSAGSKEMQGKTKEDSDKSAMVNGSSKGAVSEQSGNTTFVLIKEAEEDTSAMEVDRMDVMVEELLRTSDAEGEYTGAMQSKGNENNCTYNLIEDSFKKDERNESGDEWMTDDEDKPSEKKEEVLDNYCTPKHKSSSASKLAQEVLYSHKALRNRKVKHASSEMSLALSAKGKKTPTISKSTANLATVASKQVETEIKEAELKRQQEKEMEALRRKEELLKKRTEAAKKKREEKMSKVKRTREEKEKELEAKKTKKAKMPIKKKKKVEEVVPEVVEKKTPIKFAKLKEINEHNSTFTKCKEEESDQYNMTSHWADVPPKQPANPNDYGIVDKSDCSSEEESDPRKKVPQWAKETRQPLLVHSFIPTSLLHDFWQAKPRALNIQELFGTQVSKNTLRRGLNYRTSSAVWHTPPSQM